MRFQKIITRGGFIYLAFVFMLSITVVISPENNGEQRETLITYLIDAGEINHKMAESLRTNCRHELLHAKEILNDLQSCFIKEKPTLRDDALNVLCSEVKQILLDCLQRKSLALLPVTKDESWYTKYFGSLYSSSQRRVLAEAAGGQPDPMPTIIMAVGVTATLTFTVSIAVFYLCCGGGAGQKDERPLLSLSLSDNSVASSQKGTSTNEENASTQSFKDQNGNILLESRSLNDPSHSRSSSNLYVQPDSKRSQSLNDAHFASNPPSLGSSNTEQVVATNPTTTGEDATKSEQTPIEVVPGVVGTPVFPPLKPPPGRVIPPPTPPPAVSSAPPGPPPPSAPAPPPPPAPTAPRAPLAPTPPAPPPSRVGGPPPPPAPSNGPRPPPPPPVPGGSSGPRPPGPPPPGPPPPPGGRGGPRPPGPPPPGGPRPPGVRPPRGHHAPSSSMGDIEGSNKAKLKPFFWDKVNASADDTMVWNQIKAGSFQFNEEVMETLFGYTPTTKNKLASKKDTAQETPKFIQIIEGKKAQNLSILLKALSVTTQEVGDALEEGNELPPELIQTLLKMAPTQEEELKLRLFTGELTQLGPADRFLKVVVDIPFAFKRLDCIYFMGILEEESSNLKDSFVVLEAACKELRKSRLFLKLLEAVLKTGNRMNSGTFRGGAQAFKLDTLLKLSDVKGVDGKTTLLHFVVQEIIRGEGIRAARSARELRSMSSIMSDDLLNDSVLDSDEHLRSLGLQVVSGVGKDLENVKRAAALDIDSITGSVAKLGQSLVKAKDFLNNEMKSVEEDKGFREALGGFVESAEGDVRGLLEEEKRIAALIKSTADYFHGNTGKEEGLRLFTIVRDFLLILDKVCLEVKNMPAKPKEDKAKEEKAKEEKAKEKAKEEKSGASTTKEEKPKEDKPDKSTAEEKPKEDKPHTSTTKEEKPSSPTMKEDKPDTSTTKEEKPDTSTTKEEKPSSPTTKEDNSDTSTTKEDESKEDKPDTSKPSTPTTREDKPSSPTKLSSPTMREEKPNSPTIKEEKPSSPTMKEEKPSSKPSSPTTREEKPNSPTKPSSPTTREEKPSSPTMREEKPKDENPSTSTKEDQDDKPSDSEKLIPVVAVPQQLQAAIANRRLDSSDDSSDEDD